LKNYLEAEGVSFRFSPGRLILDNISFAGKPGEFIALMGTNGAGKSTLLDILAGLRSPLSGRVLLDGVELKNWNRRLLAQRLGHLPQAVRHDAPFTVEQLVLMGRYPHTDEWFESDKDRVAVEVAMRRTNCWEFRTRRFPSLSGGERQRVLLAAFLAQEADVLLLDEPSTFLDIQQQLHCFTLLAEEAAQGKLSVAVIHDLNMALSFCTRLIVLHEGKVALDQPVEEASKSSSWLELFSPRLRMGATPEGGPWVWYR
jgi:iron complex transport system ATP-binding protein